MASFGKGTPQTFIVCIVTPETNHLLLSNSTFLKKISHSSQELRVDNIRGIFIHPCYHPIYLIPRQLSEIHLHCCNRDQPLYPIPVLVRNHLYLHDLYFHTISPYFACFFFCTISSLRSRALSLIRGFTVVEMRILATILDAPS